MRISQNFPTDSRVEAQYRLSRAKCLPRIAQSIQISLGPKAIVFQVSESTKCKSGNKYNDPLGIRTPVPTAHLTPSAYLRVIAAFHEASESTIYLSHPNQHKRTPIVWLGILFSNCSSCFVKCICKGHSIQLHFIKLSHEQSGGFIVYLP